MLDTGLVRWSFGGGAYVLLPTSDANTSGIDAGGYPERIIKPRWAGRSRSETEGGGNIDWRGNAGDILTWWGAGGRYWHRTLTVPSSTGLAAGTVYNFVAGAPPRVMYGRIGANVAAFRGGLWHNGRVVQYNGAPLFTDLSATVFGACLTQFDNAWYLHYVSINPGNPTHHLYQAPFNRETHSLTGPPVELDSETFVADRNTIWRPFLFSGSGTQGYAVRRQEDDPINEPSVYQYRLWGVEINGIGDGGFVQGDYSAVRTNVTDYERVEDSDPDYVWPLYALSVKDSAVDELLAVDWIRDTRIDIKITGTITRRAEYTGTLYDAVDIESPFFRVFGPIDITDATDLWLEWTGPYADRIKITETRDNRNHVNAFNYWILGNDGTYAAAPGPETVTETKKSQIKGLHYMDARYGILYYLDANTYDYTQTALIINNGSEDNITWTSFDGYSYTPNYERVLQVFGATKSLESWNGDTVTQEPYIHESYAWGFAAFVEPAPGNDYDLTHLPNSGYYQGVIAAHPGHAVVSLPLLDNAVFNNLYTSSGKTDLDAAGLRAITDIDDDNEGYAPLRVYATKEDDS